jgi:peptide/nickel transport system substrate-binding protein
MYVADVVREAIYDGPIDERGFDYQPVILEKLPSLADGDAVIEPVSVQAGDWVVDDNGDMVQLSPGVVVRPAGCRYQDCAVTFAQGTLQMDQLSATFRLLESVKWSDGTPLTAADSVFSFELARDPETRSWGEPTGGMALVPYRGMEPVLRTARYAALDAHTVEWVGLPGFLDPHYRTNFFIPLHEHQLGHLSAKQLLDAEDANDRPLGWGPYVLKKWTPGDRIVAERNPHYFRAAEDLPYFDRLIFRFVGQDVDRNLAALREGTCDVLTLDTQLDAQLERLLELEAAGGLKLHVAPGTVWEHLDFGIHPAPDHDRPDYFEDVRLRRAVAHCIDRQRLVDEVYHGLSVVPPAYVPLAHPVYDPAGLAAQAFDPQAGMVLLDEIGWRDADGDGVRESHGVAGIPEGTPLHWNLEMTTSETRTHLARRISQDLTECGIAVTVLQTPAEAFYAETQEGPVFGQRFDLVQFAWLTEAIPPCDLFLSAEVPSVANGWTGRNVTGYANPDYDAACEAALAALPGTQAYTAGHLEALRIFAQDLPVLPLAMRINVSAARPDLLGLMVDPSDRPETWNVEEWRLEP